MTGHETAHRAGADALHEAQIARELRLLGAPIPDDRDLLIIDTETIGELPDRETGREVGPGRLVIEFGGCLLRKDDTISRPAHFFIGWPLDMVEARRIGQGHWITRQGVGITEADFIIHPDGTCVGELPDKAWARIAKAVGMPWAAYNATFDFGALSASFPGRRIPAPEFCLMGVAHTWLALRAARFLRPAPRFKDPDGSRWALAREIIERGDRLPDDVEDIVAGTKWPSAEEVADALAQLGYPIDGGGR